jgi:hypothetical protein
MFHKNVFIRKNSCESNTGNEIHGDLLASRCDDKISYLEDWQGGRKVLHNTENRFHKEAKSLDDVHRLFSRKDFQNQKKQETRVIQQLHKAYGSYKKF